MHPINLEQMLMSYFSSSSIVGTAGFLLREDPRTPRSISSEASLIDWQKLTDVHVLHIDRDVPGTL